MPDIQLTNLTKTYPGSDTPAVNSINLTVKDGEFMCLLGPSGCGKTTILRMIAGIEHASGGEICIGDKVVDSVARGTYVPPEKRGIGLVFQSYALWPHMTIYDNVGYPLKQRKKALDKLAAEIALILKEPDVQEKLAQVGAEDGGGGVQRFAEFMKSEQQKYAKTIQDAKIVAEG